MITEVTTGPRRHGPWLLLLAFCLTACAGQPAARRPATPAPVTSENPPPLADAGFEAWLEDFKAEALGKGISQATVSRAFVGITPNDRVVELDRKQPEGTITFERYFANTVTDVRVKRGRALLEENRAMLDSVAATYGVPAKVVVALWGVESGFGANMGKFSIVRSLATLAYEGRRAAFFRDELTNALRIMDQEGFGTDKLVGSWAGAMGQCQFMPSSYLKWAVDFDGDGHRDIWATRADVFGSAANYLKQNGWKAGESWGWLGEIQPRAPSEEEPGRMEGPRHPPSRRQPAAGGRSFRLADQPRGRGALLPGLRQFPRRDALEQVDLFRHLGAVAGRSDRRGQLGC
ncbi:MAG: lytic murein transglycosylase [Zavarzinia sp.]